MRSYVKIKEETEDKLHLIKEPGLYGYTLLVGMWLNRFFTITI